MNSQANGIGRAKTGAAATAGAATTRAAGAATAAGGGPNSNSSGFGSTRHEKWFDQKYGITRNRSIWVKAHIASGVKTNVVTAARILERARATSEHQVAQSNRLWREVQAELARFSAWREQVDPIIRSVHAKVEGVRTQIEDVPEKIRQALAPMADSISMIDSDLAELSSASTPPLLLTPSGLDPGSPVNDWPIGESGAAEDPGGHAERGGGAGHLAG